MSSGWARMAVKTLKVVSLGDVSERLDDDCCCWELSVGWR